MTFRNNRGQRTDLTQVLQERQAQRQGIQERVTSNITYGTEYATNGNLATTHTNTGNTYGYGRTTWPTAFSMATSAPSPYNAVEAWSNAYEQSRTRIPVPPEIIPHDPSFLAPRTQRFNRARVNGLANPRQLRPPTPPVVTTRDIRTMPWIIKKQSDKTVLKLRDLYRTVMVMNSDYTGSTFGYGDLKDGMAKWYIRDDGTPIVTMDTTDYVITQLCLPKKEKFHNLTRYLWRILGFDAVRYKDVTLVKHGELGIVLSAGDKWDLPRGTIDPYAVTKRQSKQLELFGEELNVKLAGTGIK